MFQTFNSSMTPTRRRFGGRGQASTSTTGRSRSRGFKACNRCRVYRVKCGEKPCQPCRDNHVKCVWHDDAATPSTRGASRSPSSIDLSPNSLQSKASSFIPYSTESRQSASPPTRSPTSFHQANHSPPPVSSRTKLMRKIHLLFRDLRPDLGGDDEPSNPFPPLPQDILGTNAAADSCFSAVPLNLDKQCYFVRHFWTSWGSLFPIVTELEFQSLFMMDWQELFEKQTIKGAMIDGMTALGIQCGHAAGVGSRILALEGDSGRQCGWYYFKRCRDRLRNEGSRVTVDAIRCYILLALFQLQANQVEDAYYMVGLGIRRAHMSNLHLAPPAHLSPEESVGRIRTWWLLYWLDIHCAIQLDRPSAVQRSSISCPAPPDPTNGLSSADDSFGWAPWKGLHPWAYSFHHSKLTLAIAQALEGMPNINFIDEADILSMLEPSAERLSWSMKHLEAWFKHLPEYLSNTQDIGIYSHGIVVGEDKEDTLAHSVAGTPKSVAATLTLGIPDWLQRQRIMLEIQYHNACVLLQRSFILWPSSDGAIPASSTPHCTKKHADSAIEHATTIISMLDSTYSKSDVFDGLPMAFQALWNATTTIAAQLLVDPQGPRTEQLSQSLFSALAILDSHSHTNSDAVQVYQFTHSLICRLQDSTGLIILGYAAVSPDEVDMTFSMPPHGAPIYMNGGLTILDEILGSHIYY